VKLKVLVLSSTYPRWEGDTLPTFVHELSKRLVDDFCVCVLCPHAKGARSREQIDGVSIHRFRYAPAGLEVLIENGGVLANLNRSIWAYALLPPFLLANLAWLIYLIYKEKPDVIHAHWLIPQGFMAVMANYLPGVNVPVLVTSHGADLFAFRSGIFRWAKKLVLQKASKVTVVSQAMLHEVKKLVGSDIDAEVISMGVDLDNLFTPDKSIRKNKNSLLFVGRLVEKKGLSYLIDAVEILKDRFPGISLKVVGNGP